MNTFIFPLLVGERWLVSSSELFVNYCSKGIYTEVLIKKCVGHAHSSPGTFYVPTSNVEGLFLCVLSRTWHCQWPCLWIQPMGVSECCQELTVVLIGISLTTRGAKHLPTYLSPHSAASLIKSLFRCTVIRTLKSKPEPESDLQRPQLLREA